MKKRSQVGWSFVIALIMLVSCSSIAFADLNANGATQTVKTDNTVNNPIFEVILPTEMAFALDPYSVLGGGSVSAATYPIINSSNIPVMVGVKFTAEGDNAVVKMQSTTSAVTSSSVTKEKQLYMSVQFGKGITKADANLSKVDGVTFAGVTATPACITFSGLNTASDVVKIVLDRRTYSGSDKTIPGATPTSAAVAFTFVGKVNPGAKWEPGDVKMTAAYQLRGLTADEYNVVSCSAIDPRIYTGAEGFPTVE